MKKNLYKEFNKIKIITKTSLKYTNKNFLNLNIENIEKCN